MKLIYAAAALTAIVLTAGLQTGCKRKYTLPPVAQTITAQQLFQDFKDAKAAHEKYLGKVLEVSGLADHVGVDSADQPFVAFKGEEGAGDVQCFFPRTMSAEISQIPKGQPVVIRGVCLAKVIHVALDSCEFVKK